MANRRYSFYKGLFSDAELNFSKRAFYVREIMLEKINPERIVLPMKQHLGAAAIPCVKVGEKVLIGQCVGMPAAGTFSVPVHSGISGTVTDIGMITLPNGISCLAVTITSDKKRTLHPTIKPRTDFNISAAVTVGIIRNAGIVGMGGEGIPTAAKINRAMHLKVERLLVNCLQSEPYATSDLYRVDEYTSSIVLGAIAVAGACKTKTISFCISEKCKNEREALEASIAQAKDEYPNVKLEILQFKERFPQGNYRLIAKALYDVDLSPKETLEEKCKAVLFNCSTLCAVWEAIAENMPLTSRIVTITDDEGRGHNVLVPIGTLVTDLLGSMESVTITQRRVVWGNCLTGLSIKDVTKTPIIKTTSAITVIRRIEAPETPCIHCGFCTDACPKDMIPSIVARLIANNSIEKAKEERAMDCISCGACSYVCPAGIDLTGIIASFVTSQTQSPARPIKEASFFSTETTGMSDVSLLEEYVQEELKEQEESDKDDGKIIIPFEGGLSV